MILYDFADHQLIMFDEKKYNGDLNGAKIDI